MAAGEELAHRVSWQTARASLRGWSGQCSPDCVKGRKESLTLIAALYSNAAAMIHCLLLRLIITPDLVQHLNHISLHCTLISNQFTHFPARAVPFTPEVQVNPTATNLQPLYL